MSRFLDQLYGNAKGNVCVVTRSETGQPDIPRWFMWPTEKNIMDKYVSIRRDEDNYVSVAVFSDKSRTSQDSDALCRIVWADADTCKPEEFKLKPSIVVQTSPAHADTDVCHPRDKSHRKHCEGHFHVFWVLDDVYPAEQIQEISRRVAYEHRDQGCDLGWTFTKILRAPNTANSKWEPPYQIGDAQFTGEVYTPEDFYTAYGEPERTEQGVYDLGKTPQLMTQEQLNRLEDKVELAGVTDLYLDRIRTDLGQSWSERMYRFQMDLFRYDATPEEVFNLAWNAQCNKYHPKFAGELTQTGVTIPERRDPEGTLWREVQRTWAEFSQETQPVSLVDFEEERKVVELDLLSDSEREKIRDTPTFIDDFVDWCTYRSPGHAKDYSHALAWGVLSCALGDQAYIDSQYGKIPLNLWITIAGDSTRTRKSTVTNFAIGLVEGFEEALSRQVHIGSDATAEKLVTVLGTRDKEVSLLTIDEVHGFYRELSARQYRVGTKEKYTKLYDGTVPVVLRATEGSGNEHRARTVFNLWGIGIYDQIVESLTKEDFMSGFMYRMTWAISPPIPYTTGSSQFMNNKDELHAEDKQYRRLLDGLLNIADRYPKDEPLPMRLTDAALKRVNEFVDKLHRYVRDTEEIALDDGIDRLRDSVVKAAALLSLYNGHEEVQLFEMLVAIGQGERWFKAFQKVFRDVSGSEFSRRCNDLEAFVTGGNGHMRTEAEIYKKFSFRTTEFGELTQSLVKQGRLRHHMKQGKWESL